MEREILHIDRWLFSLFQERIFQANRNGRIYFQGTDLIFDLLVGQYVQIFHNKIRNCKENLKGRIHSVIQFVNFQIQVKLSSISSVSLLDKRGFLTICLSLSTVREGRIYLRRAEGLRDWYNVIKVFILSQVLPCF